MAQISIVYWSGTGNTELMAQKVAEGVREAGQESCSVWIWRMFRN